MTVTELARACGLSRSAILYYESLGLLKAPARSPGNYRVYGNPEQQRLRQLCAWRDAGLKLSDIRVLLDRPGSDASAVLRRRFLEIGAEIERLRGHQRAIASLLKQTSTLRRMQMISKDKWVSIMQAAGFTESAMRRWHAEFERAAPEEHQEFLEFLHIPDAEIASIREWSRKAAS